MNAPKKIIPEFFNSVRLFSLDAAVDFIGAPHRLPKKGKFAPHFQIVEFYLDFSNLKLLVVVVIF
jgi:hypothetical protein